MKRRNMQLCFVSVRVANFVFFFFTGEKERRKDPENLGRVRLARGPVRF